MQDVDEEVLDLVPGVDGVGTVQNNHNVHERLAPYQMERENMVNAGMDGWIHDGYMNGWIDDRRIDSLMDGWIYRWIDR